MTATFLISLAIKTSVCCFVSELDLTELKKKLKVHPFATTITLLNYFLNDHSFKGNHHTRFLHCVKKETRKNKYKNSVL